jgi:hypothetical protein
VFITLGMANLLQCRLKKPSKNMGKHGQSQAQLHGNDTTRARDEEFSLIGFERIIS